MSKKSASDHAIAITKAATQFVPILGGAIASLVDDYVPTSAEKAREKTMQLLNDKVSSLEGRIDVDHIDKDQFSELYESCQLLATRNRREEKLQAAASMMANFMLRPDDPAKVPYEELDYLMRCVDALPVGAIAVLGAARQLGAQSGAQENFHFPTLKNLFPQFDASLLMGLVSELRGFNLVGVQRGTIPLPDFSHVLLWLTPIGQRLVERFIEGKM